MCLRAQVSEILCLYAQVSEHVQVSEISRAQVSVWPQSWNPPCLFWQFFLETVETPSCTELWSSEARHASLAKTRLKVLCSGKRCKAKDEGG